MRIILICLVIVHCKQFITLGRARTGVPVASVSGVVEYASLRERSLLVTVWQGPPERAYQQMHACQHVFEVAGR